MDNLEALMLKASREEYSLIGESVKYEFTISINTETSLNPINSLQAQISRNKIPLCELNTFSNTEVNKESAIHQITECFVIYSRICLLSPKDFVIYNDPNDLKNIIIHPVSHNNRKFKYVNVYNGTKEQVVQYKDIIGISVGNSEDGETLKEWRGRYKIFQRNHAALIRTLEIKEQ